MKAADRHLQARLTKAARQVEGAGILVGLDPHQADQPLAAVGLEAADDPRHRHHGIGLVIGLDADLHPRAERPLLVGGAGQSEETGQGVRGNPGLDPLNDITLIVVMGGLDQFHQKVAAGGLVAIHGGVRGCGIGGVPHDARPLASDQRLWGLPRGLGS